MLQANGDSIAQAAQRLHAGGLVAFPTETVYGLGANACDDAAVANIFAAKGRPADHPLIVHLADVSTAPHFAAEVPAFAQRLIAQFWPGPLTLILPRKPGIASACAGGQASIGLRCPSHVTANALLQAAKKLGVLGVAAPSANPFGRISPTTARHVQQGFAGSSMPMLVLDGGACDVGIESTIIDCTRAAPVLLRPGMHSLEALSVAAGLPVQLAANSEGISPKASGTLEQHYAPRARLRLMPFASLQAALDVLGADAKRLAVYAQSPLSSKSAEVLIRRMPADAVACAQQLFAVLHAFDAANVALIWVETVPDAPEWDGVRDRLNRAAA